MGTQPETALQPWHSHRFAYFKGANDSNITTGEDYKTQTLTALWSLEPGDKAKMAGLAMIPSSYADYDARKHEAQRDRGSYIALTGDVDGGNHDASAIESAVEAFAPGCARLVYTSAHSRPGDQRWRIILPLDAPCPFDTWFDAQIAFYRFMEARGIAMDHALARAGQPVYLPNVPPAHKSGTALRGEDGKPLYYERHATPLNTPGLPLATGNVADGIAAIRRQRVIDEQQREQMRREAERQRANRPQGDGASLIDDFNASNTVADMLAMSGYEQSPKNGDDWKSPQQTSESYATRVMGAKWFSLSATDAASGLGTTHPAGCWGDAFDLYAFWQHGNDRKAAMRQLGRERRADNVTYPAQFHAEPPEWMNDIPDYEEPPEWLGEDGESVFDEPIDVADASDTFPLLSLAELAALPPPSWLIDGLVSDSGLSILYGDPGSGKSFVTIDMALRLALGWDWHGAETKRVGVLYIAGEGVRGLGNRIKGWRLKHDVPDDAEIPFALMPVAAQMLDPTERARLLRTIDAARVKLGFDIGLIVIDTVSRSIAGQDENGQETMSAFVKGCDEIRDHCGGAVIGVHHSGKNKDAGMRGSTVLLGACDATFRVQKADSLVTLKCEKQKDGEEAQPIYLKMERFAWSVEGNDKEQSTLIPIMTQAQSVGGNGLTMEQVRGAFSILTDAWCANKPLSHKPQTKADGRYAPLILSKRLGGDVDVWVEHIAGWLENGCLSFELFDRTAKKYGLQVLEPVR